MVVISMKVITFAAIKGGVGKTTLTYNFGEWLADQRQNILLIDSDQQASLSQTYNIVEPEYSLANVFKNHIAPSKVIQKTINQQIDILPSSMYVSEAEVDLQTRINRELQMYIWFYDHYDFFKKYDYILIDSHPDFSLVTQNMIAISDYLISPVEPSEYSFNAKNLLELRFAQLKKDLIDPHVQNKTHKSYIKAKLYYVGNRLKPEYESSQVFLKQMKQDPQTIGYIDENELLNQTTLFNKPLFSVDKRGLNSADRKFMDNVELVFKDFTKLGDDK